MEKQFAELYRQIAEKIVFMIPTKWTNLYYLGEVEKGKQSWSSVFYFYDAEKGTVERSHEIPSVYNISQDVYQKLLSELDSLLLALYDSFADNGQMLWEQVSLSVSDTGAFNVDFDYDVMHEDDGGPIRRELMWAHKTFEYVPKEGSYFRKIFDKYAR